MVINLENVPAMFSANCYCFLGESSHQCNFAFFAPIFFLNKYKVFFLCIYFFVLPFWFLLFQAEDLDLITRQDMAEKKLLAALATERGYTCSNLVNGCEQLCKLVRLLTVVKMLFFIQKKAGVARRSSPIQRRYA